MQKLSKEQAKALISRIRYNFEEYSKECKIPTFYEVEKVINQCTEKEFPKMSWGDEESVLFIDWHSEHIDKIRIRGDMNLSFKEFKKFTQGCIAITQWLEENEKDN